MLGAKKIQKEARRFCDIFPGPVTVHLNSAGQRSLRQPGEATFN